MLDSRRQRQACVMALFITFYMAAEMQQGLPCFSEHSATLIFSMHMLLRTLLDSSS